MRESVARLVFIRLFAAPAVSGASTVACSHPGPGDSSLDLGTWIGSNQAGRIHESALVPEPGTMVLLGSGLAMAAGWSRKRFRRQARNRDRECRGQASGREPSRFRWTRPRPLS